MTKQEFSELLQGLIEEAGDLADSNPDGVYIAAEWQEARVRTFEDIGLLTTDTGIHIKLADGSQFYLTIQEAN